ncbi:Uncharacterised protein [Fusobacterium polymorphum]|uniref:Uncharacterized protein n=1 Tax=Fusobacterium polymorphum ATCC 10953 TaxID=393480 RepID=A5TT60_FUSNP|nr:hypothetical protein [Fusobacterium polymorphum]EDK88085.1 hypothetical protein FNP_0270 [Fusobacterium polymorphum ATCC 10953]UTI53674.1 hypothetical protein NLJ26_03415 [Fusobacterium polymorphum]WRL68205.1 hypothetical protein VKN78_10445 [Fusobacterium polymorphum]CKG78088.1 Uncharacterised protein [Fusobacterium polymorphum]
MDILGILFILWAILTIFEVVIISGMQVSTFKYVKLLKFLEFFYVVLIIIQINFYLYINTEIFSYLSYSLSVITYFGILIYDFWKKKITKKDFIIYFLYFFIDITLIYLIMILILRNFPTV